MNKHSFYDKLNIEIEEHYKTKEHTYRKLVTPRQFWLLMSETAVMCVDYSLFRNCMCGHRGEMWYKGALLIRDEPKDNK